MMAALGDFEQALRKRYEITVSSGIAVIAYLFSNA